MGLALQTRRTIAKNLQAHKPFHVGNVSAKIIEPGHLGHTGRLPNFVVDQLKAVNRDDSVYVVYSYQTPIAWVQMGQRDSNWFIPGIHYSTTTTHHQTVIRVATLPNSPY